MVEGDALFVEEDYEGAVAAYSATIDAGGDILRVLVHRSIAHAKLARFEAAVADADSALGLDSGCAPAHFRKGVAAFQLGDFAAAEAALTIAAQLDPSRPVKMWLRKAKAEVAALPGAPPVPAPQVNTVPPPVAPAAASTASFPAASTPPALRNVKHEWYQSDSHVVLALFFKKMKKEHCDVSFLAREVEISLQLPGSSEFQCTLELCGEIVPESSQCNVLSTKVEIKLAKAATGIKWAALTAEGNSTAGAPDGGGVVMGSAAASEGAPAYPTSNRKQIDWDQMDKEAAAELEEEKPEGCACRHRKLRDDVPSLHSVPPHAVLSHLSLCVLLRVSGTGMPP